MRKGEVVREVYPNIFLKEIPLRDNPLRSINIYIIKGEEKNLIVDTGFDTEEIKFFTHEYMDALDLDLSRTGLFLTHLHSDHIGMASYLGKLGMKIYLSEVDGKIVEDSMEKMSPYWQLAQEHAHRQGLDEDQLRIEDHPGFKYRPKERFDYVPVKPGDEISVGKYNFVLIDESGHTPGMLGLYEPEQKILFCGDHILGDITPNITYWGDEYGDSLGKYLQNLEAVRELHIEHLFSSHRSLVADIEGRIEELLAHHRRRLAEVVEYLESVDGATVRMVTENMSWDIRARDWNEFPKSQKWFAAGEAQAHLEHLVHLGRVNRTLNSEGIWIYSIS